MYNLSWRELWDKPCHETIEEHGKKLEKCNRLVTWQPGTCVPVGKVLKCAGKLNHVIGEEWGEHVTDAKRGKNDAHWFCFFFCACLDKKTTASFWLVITSFSWTSQVVVKSVLSRMHVSWCASCSVLSFAGADCFPSGTTIHVFQPDSRRTFSVGKPL